MFHVRPICPSCGKDGLISVVFIRWLNTPTSSGMPRPTPDEVARGEFVCPVCDWRGVLEVAA